MKSIVFESPNTAAVIDRDAPQPGSDDVVVRLRQVGICHSDFDLLADRYILPITYPVVPGHEWTGEVVETGSAVASFGIGDRVVGECSIADDQHFGFTCDGAMAEYFKVPAAWLHRLPDGIDDTIGALVEPFAVAYRATFGFDASSTVAIFGGGPIGLCATASAAAKGAQVIVIEPDPRRRELASALGAAHAVDPAQAPVAEQVAEATGGRGADGVVEASGNPAAMADTLRVAAYGARIVNVGIDVGEAVPASLGLIVGKALRIHGQVGSVDVWPAAIRFLSRLPVDLSAIVSRRFELSRALEAFNAAQDRANNVKVHVTNT